MIKIVLTKTGEQIITKIENYLDENDNPIGYLFTNPFLVRLTPTDEVDENGQPVSFSINYTKWMTCSGDNEFRVSYDYVASVANPEKQIYENYIARFGDILNDSNAVSASDSSDPSEESGVSDSGD